MESENLQETLLAACEKFRMECPQRSGAAVRRRGAAVRLAIQFGLWSAISCKIEEILKLEGKLLAKQWNPRICKKLFLQPAKSPKWNAYKVDKIPARRYNLRTLKTSRAPLNPRALKTSRAPLNPRALKNSRTPLNSARR